MTTTPFDLTGRTAVVTGARRGIGLAIAEALARAGADIIGVSASLEPTGSVVQRRVEAAGRDFTGYQVDFDERDAVIELGAQLAARRGGHPGQQRGNDRTGSLPPNTLWRCGTAFSR